MRLNIDVTKENVDAALQAEIKKLKREVSKLKRQLDRSRDVGADSERKREAIAKLHSELRKVFTDNGWSFDLHEDCH